MTQLVRYRSRDGLPAFDGRVPSRWISDLFGYDPYVADTALHLDNRDDALVVTADLPGVAESDVEITLDSGVLTIAGTRDDRVYRYTCRLGAAVDPDRIDATLDSGVLTITAWKKPAAKRRRIAITVNGKRRGAKRRLWFRKRT